MRALHTMRARRAAALALARGVSTRFRAPRCDACSGAGAASLCASDSSCPPRRRWGARRRCRGATDSAPGPRSLDGSRRGQAATRSGRARAWHRLPARARRRLRRGSGAVRGRARAHPSAAACLPRCAGRVGAHETHALAALRRRSPRLTPQPPGIAARSLTDLRPLLCRYGSPCTECRPRGRLREPLPLRFDLLFASLPALRAHLRRDPGQFLYAVGRGGDADFQLARATASPTALTACCACVDRVPTGALRRRPRDPTHADRVTTRCRFAASCGSIESRSVAYCGSAASPLRVNRGHLCARAAIAPCIARGTAPQPLRLRGNGFEPISWA